MKPDLDPIDRAAIERRYADRLRDRLKLDPNADYGDDFDLIPTPLDAVIAGLVAIATVGIGVAAVIGVVRLLGG